MTKKYLAGIIRSAREQYEDRFEGDVNAYIKFYCEKNGLGDDVVEAACNQAWNAR